MRMLGLNNFVHGFLIPGILVVLGRTFILDWFWVPTSSMAPRILRGDLVIVAKYRYGYGPMSIALNLGHLFLPKRVRLDADGFPIRVNLHSNLQLRVGTIPYIKLASVKRGDVVCFSDPRSMVGYTKRVVAVSGDTMKMQENELVINDVPCERKRVGQHYYRSDLGYTELQDLYEEENHGVVYVVQQRVNNHPRFFDFRGVKPAEWVQSPLRNGGPQELLYLAFVGDNRHGSSDSGQGNLMPPSVPENFVTGKVVGVAFSTNPRFVQHSHVTGIALSWTEYMIMLPLYLALNICAALKALERVGVVFDEPHRRPSPNDGWLCRKIGRVFGVRPPLPPIRDLTAELHLLGIKKIDRE